jgi:hypothetical protein
VDYNPRYVTVPLDKIGCIFAIRTNPAPVSALIERGPTLLRDQHPTDLDTQVAFQHDLASDLDEPTARKPTQQGAAIAVTLDEHVLRDPARVAHDDGKRFAGDPRQPRRHRGRTHMLRMVAPSLTTLARGQRGRGGGGRQVGLAVFQRSGKFSMFFKSNPRNLSTTLRAFDTEGKT